MCARIVVYRCQLLATQMKQYFELFDDKIRKTRCERCSFVFAVLNFDISCFFCYFKLHGVVLSIGVNAEGSQGPDPQYLTCICPVCWTPVTPTQSRVQRQFKKCFTFSSKCTKMRLVARPRWGAYSAPPDPTPSWIKGGRKEGEEEGKERGRTPNV